MAKKYMVQWVKRYYVGGTVEIEAGYPEEAYNLVADRMQDYIKVRLTEVSQFKYDPTGDDVHVIGEKRLPD